MENSDTNDETKQENLHESASRVPRRGFDWDSLFTQAARLLPLVVVLCGFIFWIGTNLGDKEDFERRLERVENSLERHKELGGHAVMDARVRSMERRVDRLEQNKE